MKTWTSAPNRASCFLFLVMLTAVALGAAEPAPAKGPDKQSLRGSALARPLVALENSAASDAAAQVLKKVFDQTGAQLRNITAPDPKTRISSRQQAFEAEVAALEKFVFDNPLSAWTPSVRANLGQHSRNQGRYSAALDHWRAAWQATQQHQDGAGKSIGDFALAHWTRLLADLGQVEELDPVWQEIKGRQLQAGPLRQMLNRTREMHAVMKQRPGLAFTCGPLAVDQVAQVLKRPNYNGRVLRSAVAPPAGFSLQGLRQLGQAQRLDLAAVQRPAGNDLVVPSVIHWKQNHYGAILAQKGDQYQVHNFLEDHPIWLEAETIHAEASGYFLVPVEKKPANWLDLTPQQAGGIMGRSGGSSTIPNDQLDQSPETCPVPSGQAPKAGEGDSARGSPGGCGGCSLPPMAVWRVSEPYLNLWLEDQPLAYQPAVGGPVSLRLAYKQRDEYANSDADVFSFGNGVTSS